MGLTIHYSLATDVESPEDVLALVEKLRLRAGEMPFKLVGDTIALHGNNRLGRFRVRLLKAPNDS